MLGERKRDPLLIAEEERKSSFMPRKRNKNMISPQSLPRLREEKAPLAHNISLKSIIRNQLSQADFANAGKSPMPKNI